MSKTYQTIDFNELREILGNLSGILKLLIFKIEKFFNLAFFKDDDLNKLIRNKGWKKQDDGYVFVANHEESIKTKNIVEKIKFDDVSSVLSASVKTQVAL